MASPDPTLIAALSQSGIETLSDADAETAMNTPTYIPRPTDVTYKDMAEVWGADRTTAFIVAITQLAATTPLALLIDKLLSGPGIDPSDPQTATKEATIIAAGLATIDEATSLFKTANYPAGTGATTLADIQTARAQIAREAAVAKWVAAKQSADAAASALIDADPINATPTAVGAAYVAQLTAAMGAN